MATRAIRDETEPFMAREPNALARWLAPEIGGSEYWVRIRALKQVLEVSLDEEPA